MLCGSAATFDFLLATKFRVCETLGFRPSLQVVRGVYVLLETYGTNDHDVQDGCVTHGDRESVSPAGMLVYAGRYQVIQIALVDELTKLKRRIKHGKSQGRFNSERGTTDPVADAA